MDSVRCYECDGFGHMSKNCPRLGSGKKMCFECKQFTSHIAVNSPQRQQRLRGENSRYESFQYISGNRGGRGGRGRYSGNKRKSDSVDCHSDSKRPRPDKRIARGNKLSWRGRRRGGVKGDTTEPKNKASDHGPEIKIDTSKYLKSSKQNIYGLNANPVTDTFALHNDGNKYNLLSRKI